MQISYRREGGLAYFPGLHQPPLQLDTRDMPSDEAARLEELVAAATSVAHADEPPAAGAADCYTYTLEIRAGKRRSTLRMRDPIAEPELRAVVAYLEELRAARQGGRP